MRHQHLQPKKRINNFLATGLMIVLPVLIISACSESPKSPSAQPAAGKPVQKQAIVSAPTSTEAPKAAESQASAYAYQPKGRVDPFGPIIVRESRKAKSGDRPPLERYNITEMKLTGIVWGGYGYNAMIEGPDGKGYFVRTGTVIGPNRGVIKKITQNTLIIEEKFKNYSGEFERKEIIVELRKKQEEKP